MDYASGTHKGFAFVEFQDADDTAEALYNMDGAELMGRVLNVNLAQKNQIKLGSHKAVWSTDEWFKEQAAGEGCGGGTVTIALLVWEYRRSDGIRCILRFEGAEIASCCLRCCSFFAWLYIRYHLNIRKQ